MSTNNLQSYTDNALYFIMPEPVLDLATRFKLSYSETMVYLLHFNMGYRWKTWISTLTCRKIADRLKISERAVSMAHQKLSKLGLIERERGVRYSKFREAPAATKLLLSDELKECFDSAPKRSEHDSGSKTVYAQKQTLPTSQSPKSTPAADKKIQIDVQAPSPKSQPSLAASSNQPTNPPRIAAQISDLPETIRAAIDLKRGRYNLAQMLKAQRDITPNMVNQILSIYDRKHPDEAPDEQDTAHSKAPESTPRSQPAKEGIAIERINTDRLVTEIEQKLQWAFKGRMHDVRPGIPEEIAFALTMGTLKDKPINHGLNIALKLVREERWTAPKGFHLYEVKFQRRA